jgi:hypothetical protein
MTRPLFIFIYGIALVVALLAGCGQGTSLQRATGTVRYKGQPVEGAIVTFRCEQQSKIATGTTDMEGRFELSTYSAGKGAVAGKHKVTVTKFSAPAGVSNVSTMEEMVAAANKPKSASSDKPANQLPKRYENVETSLLEFDVSSSGTNDFKIELVD